MVSEVVVSAASGKFGSQCLLRSALLGVLLVSSIGCSGQEEPFMKETSGLTGQVFVDGVPVPVESPLKVECHNIAGMDQSHPTVSSALTGEDGRFEISTYKSGDGVPAGEYALTFVWGKINLISASYGGPDRLDGAYSDPQKSEFKVVVVEGEPTDAGKIELVTKKK